MKKSTYSLNVIVLIAVSILASCGSPSQKEDAQRGNTNDTTQVKKSKTKLDINKVPKEVSQTFTMEYPVTTYSDWYGYPGIDYTNDWYNNDPYLYSNDYPETYVVEFSKDSTPYKAVYAKSGKKVATHKAISDLPAAISTAISQGTYKDWALAKDKEEIFKDKDTDQLKAYKVEVTQGNEKHTLYYRADGTLLKDKKIE